MVLVNSVQFTSIRFSLFSMLLVGEYSHHLVVVGKFELVSEFICDRVGKFVDR
jgi:hypothetical protein